MKEGMEQAFPESNGAEVTAAIELPSRHGLSKEEKADMRVADIAEEAAETAADMHEVTRIKQQLLAPENNNMRTNLVSVGNKLLGLHSAETDSLSESQLVDVMQSGFQKQLRAHYESSGIKAKVSSLATNDEEPPDRKALNLIATESQGVHGWPDMLPALREKFPEAGLNCTMGSAMLKLALEDLGYENVCTTIRRGHSIVTRSLPDGSIVLYDPTSLSTQNGKLVGYARTFSPNEITYQENIAPSGARFGLVSQAADSIGGFMEAGDEMAFFAYEPSTVMDLAIALENLSEIKDDAQQIESELELPFDEDGYRLALAEFIAANNTLILTQEDLKGIAASNRQTIVELVQAAAKAFSTGKAVPNPYDFITDPKISPKSYSGFPNPKDYQGSSERYEQAAQIMSLFPELAELDFQEVKGQTAMFDAYEHL